MIEDISFQGYGNSSAPAARGTEELLLNTEQDTLMHFIRNKGLLPMKRQIIWLIFLLTLSTPITSCTLPSPNLQLHISSSCTPQGKYSRCSVVLISDASSPRPFNWKVTAQPASIQLGVSSGTVTPGGSNEIQFQVTHDQCPATVTFSGSDGTVIQSGKIPC